MDLKVDKLKSITAELAKFDPRAKDAYITVTEWVNGEGWDINIGDRLFSLSIGELDAIKYITETLDFSEFS